MFVKSVSNFLRNRNFLLCVMLIGLIGPMVLAPMDTYAQEIPPGNGMPSPPDLPEPVERVNTMALKYAEDYHVSEEEAVRRLALQNEMQNLVKTIEENEPQYAASWIVHEPEFGLVVSFTTPNGDTKLRKYLDGIEWSDLVHAAQSALSHGELVSTQRLLLNADKKTDIPFESGVFFPEGEIHLFTPQPDELTEYISSLPFLKHRLDYIKVIYQAVLSEEESYSPQMDGGTAISTCTAGYVLTQNSTGKRFISTAGHCGDVQRTASTSLGAVIHQQNYTYDVQVHDAFKARGVGLTNQVDIGGQLKQVTSREYRGTLHGDYVCKYGKTTGVTCGNVTSTSYQWPGQDNKYVYVTGNPQRIGCDGDSGGPVYKTLTSTTVKAVGIFKGSAPGCEPDERYFIFSAANELDYSGGYRFLTSSNPPHFYQNVFAPDGSCTQYKADITSSGGFANWHTTACDTYAPGSGSVTSYTNYVMGNYLHEALWRGGKGYLRPIPFNNNGTVNWNAAPGWSQCCEGLDVAGQGAYIAGDYFYQHVFSPNGSCSEYHSPLDENGNFSGWSGPNTCPTYAAGSGTVTSYTNYIIDTYLYEAMWRGGNGYIRSTPIHDNGTVNWGAAGNWIHCCTGVSVGGQGAYIIWHP